MNTLCAFGSKAQMESLCKKIEEVFAESDFKCLELISDIADDESFFKLTFKTINDVIQSHLKDITDSMVTDGLDIRIVSDDDIMECVEQFIFKKRKWNFENPPTIQDQLNDLLRQAKRKIKAFLSEKGSICNLEETEKIPLLIFYLHQENGYSYLSDITLEDGQLCVALTNGINLEEGDLKVNDIFNLLDLVENLKIPAKYELSAKDRILKLMLNNQYTHLELDTPFASAHGYITHVGLNGIDFMDGDYMDEYGELDDDVLEDLACAVEEQIEINHKAMERAQGL